MQTERPEQVVAVPFTVDPGAHREPESESQILRLMALYCHAIDYGDADLWADCFTEDGEYHGVRPGGAVTVISGRVALRAYAAAHASPPDAYPKHMLWSPVVQVDGDTATGMGTFAVLNDRGAGPVMDVYGGYEDSLARKDGVWRFTRRIARVEAATAAFTSAEARGTH